MNPEECWKVRVKTLKPIATFFRNMKKDLVLNEKSIQDKIYLIRGLQVMLDEDLAWSYNVETGALNQAVKRNRERFPEEFMFQISQREFDNLKSQIVTSSWGGRRALPYAFTEQGVAMLSGVLKSDTAIRMSSQTNGRKGGGSTEKEYSILTAEISKATFGMTQSEYKEFKA